MSPKTPDGGVIVTATGDGAAAMVDAADIAAVAAAALAQTRDRGGVIHAITGPQALTFSEMAAQLSQLTGRAIVHRSVAPAAMGAMLGQAGVPADYAAMLLRDMAAIREGHAAAIADTVAQVGGRGATRFEDFALGAASTWRSAP